MGNPTFQLFASCPICGRPSAFRRVLCRAHLRVLDCREEVDEGMRSDWYSTADGLPVNHATMMRTHPHELGLPRYSWQAELPAILAWLRVRLWSEPDDPWADADADADDAPWDNLLEGGNGNGGNDGEDTQGTEGTEGSAA